MLVDMNVYTVTFMALLQKVNTYVSALLPGDNPLVTRSHKRSSRSLDLEHVQAS